MLTLTGYNNTLGDADAIIVNSLDDITIIDKDDNDITEDLIESLILFAVDWSDSVLSQVFGAGLEFAALTALDTPLYAESDIGAL